MVDDPAVDPLAFAWRERFARVFAAGGFDAVVGNPPYVRQERLGAIKPHLQANFASYHGMADLYVYFYERGLSLLRPGGRLAFVVTNKWMKAGYGEPLRAHFGANAWVESVVDFGHAKQFFRDADVFPCFLVVRKPNDGPPPETAKVCVISRDLVDLKLLKVQVGAYAIPVERERFASEAWQLEPKAVSDLMEKIRRNGVPLAEYAGVKPCRGILTGFNEAFLIDTATKDRLVRDDPKSAEILKPYLRGQDIKRWSPGWAGLWMIAIQSSGDYSWPWADPGDEAETIFAKSFPSVYAHFLRYKASLISRQDQGRFWWELRSCAYWGEFSRPKILYQEIQFHPAYAFDATGRLGNNKTFFLVTDKIHLVSFLNSPMYWWFNWRHLPHMKDEALTPVGFLMETCPIAEVKRSVREELDRITEILVTSLSSQQMASADLLDWLKHQHDVAEPNTKLQNPIALTSDAFLAEVRKARGKKAISAAGQKALREEFARTIEPAKALAAEAAALELRIHDLVNEAYGLTPDEVRLMWDTAPPRMPIPRPPGV